MIIGLIPANFSYPCLLLLPLATSYEAFTKCIPQKRKNLASLKTELINFHPHPIPEFDH